MKSNEKDLKYNIVKMKWNKIIQRFKNNENG